MSNRPLVGISVTLYVCILYTVYCTTVRSVYILSVLPVGKLQHSNWLLRQYNTFNTETTTTLNINK